MYSLARGREGERERDGGRREKGTSMREESCRVVWKRGRLLATGTVVGRGAEGGREGRRIIGAYRKSACV